MGKKKKKKKKNKGPKPFLSKKKKRLLFRLGMLAALGYAYYVFSNPSVIKDPVKRRQVEEIKGKVLSMNEDSQMKVMETAPQLKKISSVAQDIGKKGIVLGEQEILVEDAVKTISSNIEKLPSTQLEKFRQDFCAPLVEQATASASPSSKLQD